MFITSFFNASITASPKDSKSATIAEYVRSNDFNERSKRLIDNCSRQLTGQQRSKRNAVNSGDESFMQRFKAASQKYKNSEMAAEEYYNTVCVCVCVLI